MAKKRLPKGTNLLLVTMVTERCQEARLTGLNSFMVLSWVAAWARMMEKHDGAEPTMAQVVADNPKMILTTAYRWAELFRRAFPEYETPGPMWREIRVQQSELSEDLATAAVQVGGLRWTVR
jgi:hypothetical protein